MPKPKDSLQQKARPQSFNGDATLLLDYFKHPGLLMSLGIIAIKWAQLELALAQYYAILVLGEECYGQSKMIAIEALEAIPTWHSKCVLLTSATEWRFDSHTAKQLKKLLFAVKDTQDDRNEVLHGRWYASAESADKWIHSRSALGPMKRYDTECLWQIIRDIDLAMTDLREFFMALKERLKNTSSLYGTALQEVLAGFEPQQAENTAEDKLGGT